MIDKFDYGVLTNEDLSYNIALELMKNLILSVMNVLLSSSTDLGTNVSTYTASILYGSVLILTGIVLSLESHVSIAVDLQPTSEANYNCRIK